MAVVCADDICEAAYSGSVFAEPCSVDSHGVFYNRVSDRTDTYRDTDMSEAGSNNIFCNVFRSCIGVPCSLDDC